MEIRERQFNKLNPVLYTLAIHPLYAHLLLPHYMSEKRERKLTLLHGLGLLRTCDELWIVSDKISDGMKGEIEEAKRLRIPVRKIEQNSFKLLKRNVIL